MKKTLKEKLEIVKEHVVKHVPLSEIKRKYQIDTDHLKYFVNLYKLYGEKPFLDTVERRKYSREMKLKAIGEVLNKKKSRKAVALELMLTDPKIVDDWVEKYLKEGESSIKDTYSRNHYLKHEEMLEKKAYKSLKERLNYLEAENEYLKKLLPLILKKSKQSKKKQ